MKKIFEILVALFTATAVFGENNYYDADYIKTIDIEKVKTMDPQNGLMDALHYYKVEDPLIVYCIAILETGNFESNLCKNGNNLFGLYNSSKNRYYKFEHWTDCVKAYKRLVERKYKAGEDYYMFLKRIKYAADPDFIRKLQRIESEMEYFD